MNPSVSLIISTYNWPQALNLCLKSVINQTQLPEEVIIADDGSGLVTKQLIDSLRVEFDIPVHHVWHEDVGFRKSLILNKAIKEALGKYIIQIDGDVILDKNFVKDHLSVAEKNTFIRGTRAHLKKNILPGIFENEQIQFSFYGKGIMNRFNALRIPALAWMFSKKKMSSKGVRGCNTAFWKEDFVAINGYDNNLQGWGCEDVEFAARLVNIGVMKKGLKFKAVQYHIIHRVNSRNQHTKHKVLLQKTLEDRVRVCRNGYHEILNIPQLTP